MTNEQIIYSAAINAGIFSEAEAQKYVQSGRRLPLHTFAEWRKHGYNVKKGEHAALTVRICRKKSVKASDPADNKEAKKTEEEEINDCYYLVTAYLFTSAQVERSKKPA